MTDRRVLASVLGDLHAYGGALLVAIGAGWAWTPAAGLMVFGAFLGFIGLFWRGRRAD